MSINGTLLKTRIRQAGYTLEEFQKELGVSRTTFYYYRTGDRPIPYGMRQRIADLLHCSFQDFLISDTTETAFSSEKPQNTCSCSVNIL